MSEKEFHILLQCGSLYKNVKVLTENGYAATTADVYWSLTLNGYIYIIINNNTDTPKKLSKKEIYHFCASSRYSS